MQRVLSILVGLVVCGLLIWTLRRIDLQGLRDAVAGTSALRLLVLSAAALAATVLQGLRFHLLLPAGCTPLRHIGLAFALGTGNILLPFRGGEVVRPFYLKRRDGRLSLRSLVAFSVIDKAIEVLCFVPFVLGACHVFATDPRFATLARIAWPIGGVSVAFLIGLCIYQIRRAGRDPERGWLQIFGPIVLSLGVWAMNYVLFYCVVPDARLALALLVGVNASLILPGLPAGIGTYEAAFVWVGTLGGLPPDQLVAGALVSHVVQIAVTLAVGVPLLATWGWPRREAVAAVHEPSAG